MAVNARREPIYSGDEPRKIILGNTLTELGRLPSENIDLISANPPYNIGEDFDGMMESRNEETFLAWLFECIDECHRILRPHGTMYTMNSMKNMPCVDLECRRLLAIKSRIMWPYDNSGVQAKNCSGSMYEPILMMIKNQRNYTFNRDDILAEAKTGAKRALIDYRKSPSQPYSQKEVPGNVREFPRVRYLMNRHENHPTREPKALLEHIILASPSLDDKVLGPFADGFITGVTAMELGRKLVGIEINTEYVRIGFRRLSIGSHLSEIELIKMKKRKTKNLSKRSWLTVKSGDLSTR